MKKNNDIIPVTYSIREYLKGQKEVKKRIRLLYDKLRLDEDEFFIYEKNHAINIERIGVNDSEHLEEYLNKLAFLRNIALKVDKSLVWVYQELVLSGLGKYVDYNSDIYQSSLLAYDDVFWVLKTQGEEAAVIFENSSVLNGHQYDDALKKKKVKVDGKR